MALKKSRVSRVSTFFKLLLISLQFTTYSYLDNLTNNDPFPQFSSVYPYSYLSTRQKAHLMQLDYCYPVSRFRISASGYRQSACFARDHNRNAINIGDLNGRWNMLALFYDQSLRDQLFKILNFNPEGTCLEDITDPSKSDPNQEFGFFTVPILYRKYGVRFETELLLVDRCFYSIGLRIQFGVADIRQTVLDFSDLTCQALGIACPAVSNDTSTTLTTCPSPTPEPPVPVARPFINENTNPLPPCPANTPCVPVGPCVPLDCVPLTQRFEPCCDATVCFPFTAECKRIVIEKIMKQKNIIFDFLGLDTCSFNRVGPEDLRINLFWRQIFVINQENPAYPRLLFMPFIDAGIGIPLDKERDPRLAFSVPIGNNNHVSAGINAGFTLDFLDTIDLSFHAGFTRFFKRNFCNVRLPTHPKESGIFPYKADVEIRPGTTYHFGAGIHAYHFLDNLSVWSEWQYISHREDRIKVCRSFIPEDSIYFEKGFLVDLAECLTKWEVHFITTGFNYDLSPFLSTGILWQAPVKQRNAYRSGTVLGTITFTY